MTAPIIQLGVGWPIEEADRERLRTVHRPIPVVVPNSVEEKCSKCGMRIWIGPRLAAHRVKATILLACPWCLHDMLGNMEADVLSLGNPDSKLEEA